MKSYGWLAQFKKTPHDLGLPLGELDPAWEEAMWIIHNAVEAETRMGA